MEFNSTDNLSKLLKISPHALASKIENGEIDFGELKYFIDNFQVPPLVKIAYLCHPNCSLSEFKTHYVPVVQKSGTFAMIKILSKATVLGNEDAVSFIISGELSEPTLIKFIEVHGTDKIKAIMSNPHINDKLRITYYLVTGDATYLSQNLKSIFVF